MPAPAAKFEFGEWLPDQRGLDNPGLTECLNLLKVAGDYAPYFPLLTSGAAVDRPVMAALRASGQGGSSVFVGASSGGAGALGGRLYVGSGVGSASWVDESIVSGFNGSTTWSLAQYNETVLATNGLNTPHYFVLGGGVRFAAVTGAPVAKVIGVIGQFVMLGNLLSLNPAPYAVQWSVINDPLNWPTPGSAPAIAGQSGIQYLEPAMGAVLGISHGDQWGLILMDGGIVRVTYQGGAVVFQFDTILRSPGPISQNAWIKVGPLIYFASPSGFFVTDGTGVIPIGHGKVDAYWASNCNFNNRDAVSCGVHYTKKLVYWTFENRSGSGSPNEMLIFNYEDKSWTHVFDGVQVFVHGEEALFWSYGVEAFGAADQKCGVFVGSALNAKVTTAEKEFNPGGRVLCKGFKPLISGGGGFSVTCKIGSRNAQSDTVTLSSALSPTPSTGFCDTLTDARYLQVEIDTVGIFLNAIGGEFNIDASSPF